VENCGKLWRVRARLLSLAATSAAAHMPVVAMRACSACAGDYEDPGRTAGPDEDEPEWDSDSWEEGNGVEESDGAEESKDAESLADNTDLDGARLAD
jgi:hypothetical protein